MDRSFLGFKQFLLRIINGREQAKPAVQPVRRQPAKSEPERSDDWVRIEF